MIPDPVSAWMVANHYGEVVNSSYVSGGCINNGMILSTASGNTFFLKTNPRAPGDMFECEAEGLVALNREGSPKVPGVYLFGTDFLLLEDLAPGRRAEDYWVNFGRKLARMHEVVCPHFGFSSDNYIGSNKQLNTWTGDGYQFFAEKRLLFQARMANRKRLLANDDVDKVHKLCSRLTELIPEQPASLLHGDLWGGNATTDSTGSPAIIDPAVHYGWAEAELAMTTLFGSFADEFYRSYQEIRPLPPGYEQRYPIYNLYHLINHLNLFGPGYLHQVQSILRRYN